jgi:DNA-binding SARP family transcriptional activator
MSLEPRPLALTLLGRFGLTVGRRDVRPPTAAERLLTYLAVEAVAKRRAQIAGTLWPETSDKRATANLRTALWRLSSMTGHAAIVSECDRLQLSPRVKVDLRDCRNYISAVRRGRAVPGRALPLLAMELLPDNDEDWVAFARERHRQLRLHALEELCRRATAGREFDRAIETGLLAVDCEPLRESSHAALIEAHLAEGNVVEARRQLESYRHALSDAGLGYVGTEALDALVGGPHPARRRT